MENRKSTILEVDNLSVSFCMYQKSMEQMELKVISELSMAVETGEVLAIVGSSGSGKSLLAHAVMGLLPDNAIIQGKMHFKGRRLGGEYQKKLCGSQISLIPQSVSYLNPLMRIDKQVIGVHKNSEKIGRQKDLFQRLGLGKETEKSYPFQLSGGMARRVLFSTAILSEADLILADEPTPGMHLDQALEALAILRDLADQGKAVVLITHDIDLAIKFADRIAVFYAGSILETARAADFTKNSDTLRHPYSKALWRALPQNDFVPIEGTQPYAGALPKGCLYAPCCPLRTDRCEENPPTRTLRGGTVRCIYAT